MSMPTLCNYMNYICLFVRKGTTFFFCGIFIGFGTLLSQSSYADERSFSYIYEANVLPRGKAELEQWITNQNGRKDGDYSAWNFRTEFEYGVTERYMSALYLNL